MIETPKQKAIREAYGKYYEIASPNTDGWCDYMNINIEIFNALSMDVFSSFCENTVRPRSLEGIGDNRGWLSVKEHGLPKEFEEVFICTTSDGQKDGVFTYSNFYGGFRKDAITWPSFRVTHYQPVLKPKPPIY